MTRPPVRVSRCARRIGSRVPSVRAWRPQEALLGAKGGFPRGGRFLRLQIGLRGRIRRPCVKIGSSRALCSGEEGGAFEHGVGVLLQANARANSARSQAMLEARLPPIRLTTVIMCLLPKALEHPVPSRALRLRAL